MNAAQTKGDMNMKKTVKEIRVQKVNIATSYTTSQPRWFVDVVDSANSIHDMRNFDNENEALTYKIHLINTNFAEVSLC